VLYAVSSAANNNGSAFAGLSANAVLELLLAFCMFFGRFGVIMPVMAIAGSLVRKNPAASTGTLPPTARCLSAC
jgi:K+-transporting ATPase ATPase A chain